MNDRVIPGAEPFAFDGGPTGVLLIHGYTGSPVSMRGWGEHLADRGYTVHGPRLPGHGTSWQDLSKRTAAEWAREVDEAFGRLAERCERVVVGALSFGCALSLHLAASRPGEVAGLALVNPYLRDRRHAALPIARLFLRTVPGTGNDIKKPGPDELSYERIPIPSTVEMARFLKEVRTGIPRVTAPLLLFHSPQDHVVPKGTAEYLLEAIGSQEKELITLPDSYHVATMDHDAPAIFERSAAFAASLG